MMTEEEIKEFLRKEEGRNLFLKAFFEVTKELKWRRRRAKCPKCGEEGSYSISGKYLMFWHWEKDEETGLKDRRWCYIRLVLPKKKEKIFPPNATKGD
ncbi:MAG: hypothetical protein ACO2PO_08490 [Candidatus Calescibacterium sp.]|jgi:hypothetical protein